MKVKDFEKLELKGTMYNDEEELVEALGNLKIIERKQITETIFKIVYLTSKNEKRYIICEGHGDVDTEWLDCTILKLDLSDEEIKEFIVLLNKYMSYTKLYNLNREETLLKMKEEENDAK